LRARTAVWVPLLTRDDAVMGAVAIYRHDVRPFSVKQIELVRMFADQAVIAIENVRLFTELQQKNEALTQAHAQVSEALEQQTATSEILRVISGSPTDIQPVLDIVAANAARVCGATDAFIRRVEGDVLIRAAHFGPVPVSPTFDRRPISRDSIAGRAVLERRAI